VGQVVLVAKLAAVQMEEMEEKGAAMAQEELVGAFFLHSLTFIQ
jgi:hypothetical protein